MFSAITQPASPIQILHQDGEGLYHTGDTAETTLTTMTIPGGVMGTNGLVRVLVHGRCQNVGGAKTIKFKYGGTIIKNFSVPGGGSANYWHILAEIHNVDSLSIQRIPYRLYIDLQDSIGGVYFGAAKNTANDQDIVVTGQLAAAGDAVAMDSILMKLLPKT